MSEPNKTLTNPLLEANRPANEISPMDWRRSSLGVGLFMLVCALFAVGSGKDLGRLLGKILLIPALLLMVVPIVLLIANSLSSMIKGRKGATPKPGP